MDKLFVVLIFNDLTLGKAYEVSSMQEAVNRVAEIAKEHNEEIPQKKSEDIEMNLGYELNEGVIFIGSFEKD